MNPPKQIILRFTDPERRASAKAEVDSGKAIAYVWAHEGELEVYVGDDAHMATVSAWVTKRYPKAVYYGQSKKALA